MAKKKVSKPAAKKKVKSKAKPKAKKEEPKPVSAWVCRDPRGILVYEKEPTLNIAGVFEKGGRLLKTFDKVGPFVRKYGKNLEPGTKRKAQICL